MEENMKEKGITLYREFIDEIVNRRECMTCRWIQKLNKVTNSEEEEYLNDFLHSLNDQQKACLCTLLQDAKDAGIHDVLAFLDEELDLEGMVISKNGTPLVHDHYDSMHYDFVARAAGDAWPDY